MIKENLKKYIELKKTVISVIFPPIIYLQNFSCLQNRSTFLSSVSQVSKTLIENNTK
jgi:hypothetical protein